MTEFSSAPDKKPNLGKVLPTPGDLFSGLQQGIKEWWAVLAPVAAAITAGLTGLNLPGSWGQALGWILALAFVGVAAFVWRRKQRQVQEQADRQKRVNDFEASRAVRTAFRGLAPFGSGDFLPGPQRRREAGTIFTQVTNETFRFGIVSGDTGAGKSSLLRAELAQLLGNGGFATTILGSPRQAWLNAGVTAPTVDRAVAIIEEWVTGRLSSPSEHPRFLIVDQFEELFIHFRNPADRQRIGRYFDKLIRGVPPIRLLCSVRRDYFVDFRDLAPDLVEPLSTQNTFLVRNFTRTEAEEVIRECAERDGIEMPRDLPGLLANDLADQNEVRPAELQIVCTALRGDFRLQHYRTTGGAAGILSKHIALAVETTKYPALARLLLRSLCDFVGNAKAQPATVKELVLRIGAQRDVPASPESEIQTILVQFEAERLVVRAKTSDGNEQWSLIHDYLVEPVKLATQDASTRAEEAARLLKALLAEARSDRTTVIPVNKLADIRRYSPKDLQDTPEVKRLLRRSYLVGYGRPAFMAIGAVLFTATIAGYVGTVSIWRPDGELRHWTGNESGDVGLRRYLTSKGPVVLSTSDQIAVIWNATNGREIERYRFDGAVVGDRYLSLWKNDTKTLKAINMASITSKEFPYTHNSSILFFIVHFDAGDYLVKSSDKPNALSLETGEIISDIFEESAGAHLSRIASNMVSRQVREVNTQFPGPVTTKFVNIISLANRTVSENISVNSSSFGWSHAISPNSKELLLVLPRDRDIILQIWNISEKRPSLRVEKILNLRELLKIEDKDKIEIKGIGAPELIFKEKLITLQFEWDPRPINAVLRATDLELLEFGDRDRANGVLEAKDQTFTYFARANGDLAFWNDTNGELVLLGNANIVPEDDLAISNKGNVMIVKRPSSILEFWDIDKKVKASTVVGIRVKKSFYTTEDRVVTALQEGGSLQLWSLAGKSLGTIAGVGGGDNIAMTVINCRAIVWTSEGQVRRFTRGWQILGLFFVPHRDCRQAE
jgi:hypothetical protein